MYQLALLQLPWTKVAACEGDGRQVGGDSCNWNQLEKLIGGQNKEIYNENKNIIYRNVLTSPVSMGNMIPSWVLNPWPSWYLTPTAKKQVHLLEFCIRRHTVCLPKCLWTETLLKIIIIKILLILAILMNVFNMPGIRTLPKLSHFNLLNNTAR